MLIDFADDSLIYLYKQKSGSADGLGMTTNDPVGGVPFQGRISRISSQKIIAWGTLGLQADAEMYCNRDDLEIGDVVMDDANVTYLVQSRARSIAKGNIHTFWKYAIHTQSLS